MAIGFAGIAFKSTIYLLLCESSVLQLSSSSSEEVDVVSIIVDELSTRPHNLLHIKSILHFRLLVFPTLTILRVGDARDLCVVCFGDEHTHSQLSRELSVFII